MGMYPNMIHPIPSKKFKKKKPSIKTEIKSEKEVNQQQIEKNNGENKEEIKPQENIEQKEEN